MAQRESNALTSEGIKFSRGDGSSSYTEVAEVTDVSGLDGSTNILNPTTLADSFVRKTAGLRDAGTVTLTLNFNPAETSQQQLRSDWQDGSKNPYQIEFPDGTTIDFTAICTDYSFSASIDSIVTADLSFAIDGPVEITAGAAA